MRDQHPPHWRKPTGQEGRPSRTPLPYGTTRRPVSAELGHDPGLRAGRNDAPAVALETAAGARALERRYQGDDSASRNKPLAARWGWGLRIGPALIGRKGRPLTSLTNRTPVRFAHAQDFNDPSRQLVSPKTRMQKRTAASEGSSQTELLCRFLSPRTGAVLRRERPLTMSLRRRTPVLLTEAHGKRSPKGERCRLSRALIGHRDVTRATNGGAWRGVQLKVGGASRCH